MPQTEPIGARSSGDKSTHVMHTHHTEARVCIPATHSLHTCSYTRVHLPGNNTQLPACPSSCTSTLLYTPCLSPARRHTHAHMCFTRRCLLHQPHVLALHTVPPAHPCTCVCPHPARICLHPAWTSHLHSAGLLEHLLYTRAHAPCWGQRWGKLISFLPWSGRH